MSDHSLPEEFRIRTPRDGDWMYTAGEIRSGLADGTIKPDWQARREKSREWTTLGELLQWIEKEEDRRRKRAKDLLAQNPPSDALCRIRNDGREDGPFLPDQIRKMWDAGQIKADATYTFDALGEWLPVRNMFVPATGATGPTEANLGSRSVSDAPNGQTTDIFAVFSFATGLLGLWVLPIVLAPLAYVSAIISYFRIKERPTLKGTGLRLTGAILGTVAILYMVFFPYGLHDRSRRVVEEWLQAEIAGRAPYEVTGVSEYALVSYEIVRSSNGTVTAELTVKNRAGGDIVSTHNFHLNEEGKVEQIR